MANTADSSYQWEQLKQDYPQVGGAFQVLFGPPSKDLLKAGMRLYKYNGNTYVSRPDGTMSEWWSPVLPYKHDGGLEQRMKIAKLNGVSNREWGRLTSAIKEEWSSMEYLLEVTLKVDIHGWFGGFAAMERGAHENRKAAIEKKGSSKKLPGGGTQFFIPNFLKEHLSSHSLVPLL